MGFEDIVLSDEESSLLSLQEQGKCRAWNESRCPHGLTHVDYTDPNRINNILIASNVKVIDPNTTIIYRCPVLIPDQDDVTSVFVVPKGLGIKVGDVLSSAQAGGIMHKVNDTTTIGKICMSKTRSDVYLTV